MIFKKALFLLGLALISTIANAGWIAPPHNALTTYGIFHFRKTITLAAAPDSFNIRISADNRYQLFVNGKAVVCGPQRSDVAHWRYDELNLASYLQQGQNVIAVTVWNQGAYAAWAQLSLETGLWIDGAIRTDNSWRVLENTAYTPLAEGEHITGPFEQVYAPRYPWGWQEITYDDSRWAQAIAGKDRTVLPRAIPFPEETPQRFAQVRKAEGMDVADGFLSGKPVTIEPNARVSFLIDQGTLTNAYPELLTSGGLGSKITLTYSEALYDKDGQKGNRNEVDGKRIKGNKDAFILDGGHNRLFRPLYYRTFRYVEMRIETQQSPLTIQSLTSRFTGYPFVEKAHFKSSDTGLSKIWETGWRTSRMCAYETYMDCPYYEQLQYIGDTRIQALISLYVSGDDRLMKNAILQFDQSRIPEGLTQSRYPNHMTQVIPPFSLFWIAMLHDYHMLGSDDQFIKPLLPGVKTILDWHKQYISPQGMLGKVPYWNFVDWPDEWPWRGEENTSGNPASALTGNSAILTLQYVYALNNAAALYRSYGLVKDARDCAALADRLKKATYDACWDASKGMLADDPDKKEFSQHTNAMAVLTDAVPVAAQAALLKRISQKDLIQCTIYYGFYLLQAFKKAGLGDEYTSRLQPWYDMIDIGLTTFAERLEPTRSDCHAWSASPNYDLLATVCGITPAAPGFKQVRIEPRLGPLQWVDAAMPHPLGMISVKLSQQSGGVTGTVTLPAGLSGEFIWGGKKMKLMAGEQKISLR